MLRISQSIGKKISVGFFGYTGKEDITSTGTPYTSEIRIYGPDLAFNFNEKLFVNFQYLWRTDSEVYSTTSEETLTDVSTSGGFAEIIYAPKADKSKVYLVGLFNLVDSQLDELDYQSASLQLGYLLRRNVRVVAEGTYIFSGDNPYPKASAGFVSAF